jgi:hypothetical protein
MQGMAALGDRKFKGNALLKVLFLSLALVTAPYLHAENAPHASKGVLKIEVFSEYKEPFYFEGAEQKSEPYGEKMVAYTFTGLKAGTYRLGQQMGDVTEDISIVLKADEDAKVTYHLDKGLPEIDFSPHTKMKVLKIVGATLVFLGLIFVAGVMVAMVGASRRPGGTYF